MMTLDRKSGRGGGGDSGPFSSRKSHDSATVHAFAVFAAVIILSAVFVPTIPEDSVATSSDSWACRITMDGTTLVTEYSEGGGDFVPTAAVEGFGDGKTEGSWGYDEDGYGPFGSFYAAFDPNNNNEMVCHLNPYNLKEAVGGGTSVEGDGRTVNISECNIMWCLPRIYLSLEDDGNTMVLASDDTYGGTLAPAFTLKDGDKSTDYNYLALGVYEATSDGTRLGSISGTSPQSRASLTTYRTEAKANPMVEDSVAQLWNFHQYQLYRLCSLAVMENFDSQGQVGYGNIDRSDLFRASQTGALDIGGPYQGTSGQNQDGVKLFIENSWGSLWEYVDDTAWYGGIYAGQNVDPADASDGNYTANRTHVYPHEFQGWGTNPSTEKDCWGLPTEASSNSGEYGTSVAPDYIWSGSSGSALIVGVSYNSDSSQSGLSCLDFDSGMADGTGGSRLAFLFAADPGAKLSVRYMDNGTRLALDGVQRGQQYTISDLILVKEGFTFAGWSDGTDVYRPGDNITVERSITLTAVWGHMVTFDLKGGAWNLEDTIAAESGSYEVPATIPTKNGFVFKGWKCGNETILPGGIIDLNSDVTLQAVWMPKIVPIIPDSGDDPMEVVIDKKDGSGSGIDGKSILLIAAIVAIIAELAVLTLSRKR